MKLLTPLLLLLMMIYPAPAQGEDAIYNTLMTNYKEYYIRTYGEVSVTGTVQNTGQGVANRVMLTVGLYADQDCTQLVYEGQSPICDRMEAGAIHQFELKHKYEFTHEGGSKGVKLSVSNN